MISLEENPDKVTACKQVIEQYPGYVNRYHHDPNGHEMMSVFINKAIEILRVKETDALRDALHEIFLQLLL